MVEHLLSMHQALSSAPALKKQSIKLPVGHIYNIRCTWNISKFHAYIWVPPLRNLMYMQILQNLKHSWFQVDKGYLTCVGAKICNGC
jgi:hypothetical protein